MKRAALLALLLLAALVPAQNPRTAQSEGIFGFRDSAAQRAWEKKFLAVPDAASAGEHLRILTAEPHMAGTPGGRKVAEYIASKLREYGFESEIVEYRVWMNHPAQILVSEIWPDVASIAFIIGPSSERVEGDRFQDDPRVVTAFHGYSASGEVEGEVVYANYGRPEDFDKLAEMKVDVRGKVIIARYGQNFRGVKAYVAEERGAAGLIIYSDPIDDGYFKGDPYPDGPWRPASGVQRGSVLYIFKYPGDPTTPGVASVPALRESERTPPEKAGNLTRIPTTPLSHGDAQRLLEDLDGPESPREWQGALPFTYHVGPGPIKVKLVAKQEYAYRSIYNVIGRLRGTDMAEELVTGGNHHDPWVYGAVDPNSGTATMLEAARALGALVKQGWRPRRTIVLGAWDAEEQGLIGSTEWVEDNARALANAVVYFNVDSAVSGPNFSASAVPSLKQFVRDVTQAVPSPKGGNVYEVWREEKERERREQEQRTPPAGRRRAPAAPRDVPVGNLGSGSDYTPFLQHLGVPATDMGSGGPYGVYHSVFDNFQWFRQNADPEFRYLQQMARVYGLQVLRMANADVLPFDYENYGREIADYVRQAQTQADAKFGRGRLDLRPALDAARRVQEAGRRIGQQQRDARTLPAALNRALRDAERAFLIPEGLPGRPWFRHAIYAPGVYTGYAAVVLPGVNEAITAGDLERARAQLTALAAAIQRAAQVLEAATTRRTTAATD